MQTAHVVHFIDETREPLDHPSDSAIVAQVGEWRRGIARLRSCRTGREPLDSSGSHPSAVGVLTHGLHQEFPIDSVEEALDVEVKDPVTLPTSLPSPRLERRGPIFLADSCRSPCGIWAPVSVPGTG